MQKTMITATTVFALLMSAGASMAGPLSGHGFGGKAHGVRASVSQALNNADQMAHTQQITIRPEGVAVGEGFPFLSSKQSLSGTNLATSQQTGLYGSDETAYHLDINVDFGAIKNMKDSGDDLWIHPTLTSSEENKIIPVEQ
ncbi:hypothetical protein [Phaeobacter gallaeciensis]|uniref:hypothetical protein n=1 Tax=Phaeobacter gallaeciensis TaxID=60890 RepID=UPI000BBC0342|nr:hypothetical protein [Phaeobacter gallaeciensis]ATF18788.1 outer membrane autotransporter [Phaeobacter gallaeciensis]ATF22897.1 outer membrane autotransporter [Phaeobacter gallaeciensis]